MRLGWSHSRFDLKQVLFFFDTMLLYQKQIFLCDCLIDWTLSNVIPVGFLSTTNSKLLIGLVECSTNLFALIWGNFMGNIYMIIKPFMAIYICYVAVVIKGGGRSPEGDREGHGLIRLSTHTSFALQQAGGY